MLVANSQFWIVTGLFFDPANLFFTRCSKDLGVLVVVLEIAGEVKSAIRDFWLRHRNVRA